MLGLSAQKSQWPLGGAAKCCFLAPFSTKPQCSMHGLSHLAVLAKKRNFWGWLWKVVTPLSLLGLGA